MAKDDNLFSQYDISQVIQNQRQMLMKELDGMTDERILATDLAELESYAVEKYQIEMISLGQPEVDHARTKMSVGRYGGFRGGYDEPTVEVDAQRYTLEVPFTGDSALLLCRGSTYTFNPPRGAVTGQVLSTTIIDRSPSAEKLNADFDRFLAEVRQHLDWLKNDVQNWNASIGSVVGSHVQHRRERMTQAGAVATGLKFGVKSRTDRAATFSAPVAARKKITPQLPAARPALPPEPVLSDAIYRDILDTLQQMAEVMERSPHAYADMDEETLRFQFLVPLNAKYEGEARGEVFNYGGKTDILITHKGQNIFVGECKIWKGAKALKDAIDQVLGYLGWRDTKAAILLFNRNRSFSDVLAQIRSTVEAHAQCASFDGSQSETEFSFTFTRPDDPGRKLKLTVLAFDTPGNVDGQPAVKAF